MIKKTKIRQTRKSKSGENKSTRKLSLFYFLAVLLVFYILFINLRSSAFFSKTDRLNIVYSADKIAYYSIGINDKVNYFIPFFSDLEVVVPGGYGYYRLGALIKLAELEKKPDLFKKTYSQVTSSKVDYYFIPTSAATEITYGKEKSGFFLPRASVIFLGKSNAGFFDRLYVYFRLFGKSSSQFKIINSLSVDDQGKRQAFLSDDFFESIQGIFYKRSYREEKRDVQIIYTKSYKTAYQIGKILEGDGIRVADFTEAAEKNEDCKVIEETMPFSETAKSLGQFFGCQLTVGDTEAYDIILKLGKVEKEWEIE